MIFRVGANDDGCATYNFEVKFAALTDENYHLKRFNAVYELADDELR
jgi:hypothetical protein